MREKLVRQHSIRDCGPASLASIISYYKGYISVDALSEMMHTSSSGTTAYDLIEVAKKIGFDAKGVKTNDISNIKLPCICHVILDKTYHHYVVLYKYDYKKDKLLIADPASGFKYYSLKAFMDIWDYFVIELTPVKVMPKTKNKSLFIFSFNIFKSNIKVFIFIIILSYLLMIVTFIYTYLIKYMIDNIYNINNLFIILFIIIGVLKIIIYYLTDLLISKITNKININLTNNIINSLIKLPYPYYCNYTTGEILSRYNDVEKIKTIISESLNIIIQLPLVLILIILLLSINKNIGILLILIIIIYLFCYFLLNNEILKLTKHYHEKKDSYTSRLVESIRNYESIKSINITNNIIDNLINKNMILEKILYSIKKIYIFKNTSFLLLNVFFIYFLIYIKDCLSLGSIFLIYYIFNLLIDPLTNIIDFICNYKKSSFISRRIEEFKIKNNDGNRIPCNYNIRFDNLNYSYGLKPILKNVDLTINHGSKVFILGTSGSGKSTLVKLIKGFYKTNNLYIGDTKINRCSKDKIIYVGQNDHLFTDTLKNNLFSNKDLNIIKKCLVNKDLSCLIEEDGFNISGGEKNRIILARAILRDFEILILDETLENVDSNSERIILKNIIELFKDKTIIFISHRLDNLDLFDSLIQIEDGNVSQIGYLN